jgi:hypothetical protein
MHVPTRQMYRMKLARLSDSMELLEWSIVIGMAFLASTFNSVRFICRCGRPTWRLIYVSIYNVVNIVDE